MRSAAYITKIEGFMAALGSKAKSPGRIYFTGGATAAFSLPNTARSSFTTTTSIVRRSPRSSVAMNVISSMFNPCSSMD